MKFTALAIGRRAVALFILSCTVCGCVDGRGELRTGDADTSPAFDTTDDADTSVPMDTEPGREVDAGTDADTSTPMDTDSRMDREVDVGADTDGNETCRSDAECSGEGVVCDEASGQCVDCQSVSSDATGSPPMNGYWYKGYHFDWSPIHERRDWPGSLSTLADKLGAPAVLGVGLSSEKWAHLRGDTEEAIMIEPVARWIDKNDGKSIYQQEDRYVYYVTWLFPGEVRKALGRDEAYRKAADGDYNDHYRKLAEKFTKHGIADQVILRVHPEHNGDWQGYAGGNEKKFKQAWRQFADTVRAVDADIKLAYSPSIHHSKQVAVDAYPGDEYVDYLGLSGIHDGTYPVYEDEQKVCGEDCEYPNCSKSCNDKLFEQAWNYYRTHEFGLDAAANFADQHDLPIAFLEWGLKGKNEWSGGDNPRFIRAMYEWMVDHNVHFQTEFEAKGKEWHLASGNVPDSLSAYRDTFKSGASRDHVAESRSGPDTCGDN